MDVFARRIPIVQSYNSRLQTKSSLAAVNRKWFSGAVFGGCLLSEAIFCIGVLIFRSIQNAPDVYNMNPSKTTWWALIAEVTKIAHIFGVY